MQNNLFYDLCNKRWYKKKEPINFDDFKNFLLEYPFFCNNENLLNLDMLNKHYVAYQELFNNQEIPIYKRSNPYLSLGFCRNNTKIEYYIDRCYNHEYAIKLLNSRQNTVSKKSFIDKYGVEIGESKYLAYVNKWKDSISTWDKKELYKNWKNSSSNYVNKINPETNKNYTEDEANSKIKKDLAKGFTKVWNEYRNGDRPKSIVNTTLEYYLNKGMSIDSATLELKKRQIKNGIEFYIQKYGEIEGKKHYNNRINNWIKKLDDKSYDEKRIITLKRTRNLPRFSKEATDFFIQLLSKIDVNLIKDLDIFYGDNEMILWDYGTKRPFFYDFSIPKIKLIIEYNGSIFHPNLDKLNESEILKWQCPFTKVDAITKNEIDSYKIKFAESIGYQVIVIWDTDEYTHKTNKCLQIIENKLKNDN